MFTFSIAKHICNHIIRHNQNFVFLINIIYIIRVLIKALESLQYFKPTGLCFSINSLYLASLVSLSYNTYHNHTYIISYHIIYHIISYHIHIIIVHVRFFLSANYTLCKILVRYCAIIFSGPNFSPVRLFCTVRLLISYIFPNLYNKGE